MTGRFIVLEGGEGVGKSTQAARLARRLTALGHRVDQTREPGGTERGNALRQQLLHGQDLDAGVELDLMLEDRRIHIEERIRPDLADDMVVVCERFTPSTLAYQGVARGLGLAEVERRCKEVTGDLEPDVVIVLDVPDAEADARITGLRDRFERAGAAFHERVRGAYRELAPSRGWVVVDSSGTAAEVAERVWAVVEPVLSNIS